MCIKHFVAFLFIAAAMLLAPSRALAQTAGSEAEVIKRANELFEKEDYPAAMPLYSQLLANHRDDPNYNYRYGVCVLYASSEKDKGLPFLEKASKSPDVEPDVWFYLGKAYHLNYRFEQAITAYSKYKSIAGAKKAEKLQVDNQIAMCKTGRKLLKAITDITVLDRAELDRSDFFRHYDLKGSGYSGQLLVKPDEFKTALDKKKNEQSIIFLSGEKTELYFASYGEDETQGKDIYVVRKLPNGTWGKPQNVGYPINTEYDEDYPFLHPNGKVLYFSSKGHNSMGGYDIFRAELNEETNTWQKPVNLDFAINSPDDDIMFVSDLDEKTAWFASNRSSPDGKMTVYHVVIERKPVNMCLIAGTYSPTKNDPSRSAKITVKNAETNEPIGVYKSNEKTGAYLISLPNNGGKYTFTVDHSGIATQTENVFIPPQYSIKTLNQQIGYNEIANDSKLFIITDFDTDSSMLDPSFLKDKAKLDINNSEPEVMTVTDISHTSGTLPEAGGTDSSAGNETDSSDEAVDPAAHVPSSKSGVTSEELVKSANDYAQDTQDDANVLSQQSKRAFSYAADLNKQAKEKTQEAASAKTAAGALPEGPEKTAAQHKADSLQTVANTLQAQTIAATDIATALDHDTKQKQLEADKAKQYASNIDKAVKANDQKALDAASSEEKELDAMSATRPESSETAKNLQEEADKKHKELDKARSEANDLKEEIAGNETRIQQLKADQAKEKDADMKQQIDQQIGGINEDIADDQKELAAATAKADRLQNQVNELDNRAKATSDALAQSKNPAIAPVAMNDADKKALSADAQTYQHTISDGADTRTYAPVAGTQGSTPAVVSTQGSTASVVPKAGTQTQSGTQASTQTQSGTQNPDTQAQASTQTSGTQTQSGTQNPDTQTQASTQTSGTQDSAEDTSGNVVENENPDAQYTSDLQSTDTISNPVAREKAKAEVYNNWAATIDDQIKDKKQELAGTTDKAKKAALNDEIKKLQASQKEKQNESKQSLAAADKAQKANAGTSVNPVASSDAQFEKQLAAANQQGTTAEKENAKADVYSDWADTLDAQAAAKEKALPKIRSKAEQDKAKQEIAALKAEADQKRNLADAAKTNAETATTNPAASGTQTTASTQQAVYDAPDALASLKEKQAVESEADAHRNSMDSLTALAANAQGADKTKLLAQANEEQRQAWATDAQAANLQAEANKAQFNKNVEQLSTYDGAGVNSTDTLVLKAEHLSQDAKSLFLLSDEDRAAASKATDNYTRSENLRKAEEEEAKAIQKQQEAFAAYKASGLKPLTTPVASTQTSGTQTQSGTQNPGTQTTQTSGTQTQSGTQNPDTQTQASTQTSGTQTQSGTQNPGTQTTQTSGTQTQSGTQNPDTQTSGTQTQSGTQNPDTQTTQTSGTQTTSTQNTPESDTSNAPGVNDNPDVQYANALQNTDTISNPIAREKAKAAVYNDWSANIGKQISDKKEELAITKDKNKKAALNDEIKKLQASQKEKQNGSKQSLAAADKAQKANAGTSGNPVASGDVQFEKQLAAANQQGTTAEKENAKAEVYSDWADTLDAQAAAKEKALPKIRSKAEQDKAKQEIAALKEEADQKRNLADAAKTNAETATTNPAASGTPDTQSSGTASGTQGTTPAIAATDVKNPSTGQPFSEQQLSQIRATETYQAFTPLNADAVKSEQRLAELKLQADHFQSQADANVAKAQDLSVAASDEKDVSKKQELLLESKKYNDAAKANMVSRDSVNGLSESVAYDAKAKRTKADLALQNLDNPTKEQVKAVADADQSAANSSARVASSGTQGTTPASSGTQGTTPASSGTQGTNPVASGTQGTNPVASGTQGTTPASSGTQGTSPASSGTQGTTPASSGTQGATPASSGTQGANPVASGTQGAPPASSGTQGTTPASSGTQGTNPASSGTQRTNPVASGTQGSVPASSVSTRLDPGEQFKITPRATSAEAIPVNPALPEGLVFKVQIGAFRNPISPDLFKNIQPVTGETTASGLTRYTAGLFKKFSNADAAKNEVRALGYRDAFVVAFYNGKRISMEEALRMSGETGALPVAGTQGAQTPATTQGSNSTPAVAATSQGNNSTPATSAARNVTHSPDAAKATDVSEVKGLFYTVQVGVFSFEVSSKKLYNLSGLFSEHTPSGLIRYSAGKYSQLDAATASKNQIVALGIKDAFVTAYYNGKRISVTEAQELEAKGEASGTVNVDAGIPAGSGSAPATTNPPRAATPSSPQNTGTPAASGTQDSGTPASRTTDTNPPATQTPESGAPTPKPAAVTSPENQNPGSAPVNRPAVVASTKIPVPDTGIVFSVQIGAFLEEVPLEIANQFIQLSSHGVKNYLDPASGLTVYQVGVLSTRAEADALRSEAVSKGITDAFIVAFKDGKKISMDEALKSTGQ